jgi:multidrug resistance efflux pump
MADTIASQSFGFPAPAATSKHVAVTRPTPLPKRPKGRWVIGFMLLTACAYAGYQVWDGFFRYRAYGTVTGKIVEVSPPWDGDIAFLRVREGDQVRQGDVLVILESQELRHRLEQIDDESRLAQAMFEAEGARLKWLAAFQIDHAPSAVARLQEALATLDSEKSVMARLANDRATAATLLKHNAIARADYERLHIEHQGQCDKVARLEKALAEYKQRGELSSLLLAKDGDLSGSLATDGQEQLKHHLVRMVGLRAERERVDAKLARGKLTAPCTGVVIKVFHAVGERVRATEPIVAVLEEGSLRVVLYVPQASSQALAVGQDVDVFCDPYAQAVPCKVIRLADRFEVAPEHLKRHYAVGQHLLPVYAQPAPETARWLALRNGGTVKLP